MKKILQGLLIVSSIALVAAGCNKAEDQTNSSANNASQNVNANTPTNTTTNTPANTAAGTTKTFVVSGDDFKFSPSEIRVKQGDTVVINFSNPDTMPHDWVVDEFSNARTKVLTKDQSESITFVADKKGTFEYYCSVGQHRAMGMKGNLIVE